MKAANTKYLQKVWQVPRNQMNSKNKIQATNTYALPMIRYPAGIYKLEKGGDRSHC